MKEPISKSYSGFSLFLIIQTQIFSACNFATLCSRVLSGINLKSSNLWPYGHNDARYEVFLLVQKNLLLFANQLGRVLIKREESTNKLH